MFKYKVHYKKDGLEGGTTPASTRALADEFLSKKLSKGYFAYIEKLECCDLCGYEVHEIISIKQLTSARTMLVCEKCRKGQGAHRRK